MAGIININLIERKRDGFTGRASVNAGYGENPKYGGTLNLNVKKKNFYAYANLSANVDHAFQRVTLLTNYQYPSDRIMSEMYSFRDTKMGIYSGELGVNYDLTAKTTIGLLLNFYNRDWTMNATSDTKVTGENSGNSSQFIESNEINNLYRSLYNFNLRHAFSDAAKLNFDYDYINFNRSNPTFYNAENININGVENKENFYSSAETPLEIHVLKSDFEIINGEKFKIETGAKLTSSSFVNNVVVSNLQGTEYVNNPDFTQIYTMTENIYAGYVSLDWQIIPEISVKGGLRYEYYDLLLGSNLESSIIDTEQGNLFPSLYFTYRAGEDQSWDFSYVQRIQRPGFLQLAPYFYFFNENSLFTGNPNLSPAKTFQFKLGYRYKNLNIGAEFSDTKDPIFGWQPALDAERQIAIFGPSQGVNNKVYSLSASYQWEISDRWISNYTAIGYHSQITPDIQENPVTFSSNSFVVSMNHTYKITKTWNIELNAIYNSAYYEGVARIDARPGVNIGVQRKFSNGAAISLNANDLFDTDSQWPILADLPDQRLYYNWRYDGEGPIFRLNISIPLGNKNMEKRTKRATGSEDEQNRL